MKAFINRILRPFNVELHGSNYIKKIRNADPVKDAFKTQVQIIKTAHSIFDVGANRGGVTQKYTNLYPTAAIYAFEPFQSFHTGFLEAHGGNPNIRLIPKALSASVATEVFYVNNSADTNSLLQSIHIGANSDKACRNISKTEVSTDTIDHYCMTQNIAKIDILKLDTQGSELAILKGAIRLLESRKISLIYTEAYFQPQYRDQPLFYHIAGFLQEYGYFLEDIYDPYYSQRHLLWCDAIFIPK